jgi:hypothetical protein
MGFEDIIIAKSIVFSYTNLNTKSTTLIYEKYMNLVALEYPRFQAPKFSTTDPCDISKIDKYTIIPNLHLLLLFQPNTLPAAFVSYNSIVS